MAEACNQTGDVWPQLDHCQAQYSKCFTLPQRMAIALGVDKRRPLNAVNDKCRRLFTSLSIVLGGHEFADECTAEARINSTRGRIIVQCVGFPDRDSATNALERLLGRAEYDPLFNSADADL